jgi:hypothetical protein
VPDVEVDLIIMSIEHKIDEAAVQLAIIRIMAVYNLDVNEAVDKILIDYKYEAQIGLIIQAGESIKQML